MLTFYSDPAKKQERIERHKRHVEADRLIAGCYQDDSHPIKGCSVGCDAIDISGNTGGNCHKVVAEHDGVPEWLERLRDVVFEGLPDSARAGWHLSLTEVIPVGVEIGIVQHQLAEWILSDDGPMHDAVTHATVKDAISLVRNYHQNCINGVFESESAALHGRQVVVIGNSDGFVGVELLSEQRIPNWRRTRCLLRESDFTTLSLSRQRQIANTIGLQLTDMPHEVPDFSSAFDLLSCHG